MTAPTTALTTVERRVAQVRRMLEKGEVLIVFHPDTGDVSLAHRHSIPADMLRDAEL